AVDPGYNTVPVIIGGRTLMPIRAVVEAMGGVLGWAPDVRQVTLNANGVAVVMFIGNTDYYVNGRQKTMDTAPVVKDGRTLIPVRFAAEALGCKVDWKPDTQAILITYGPSGQTAQTQPGGANPPPQPGAYTTRFYTDTARQNNSINISYPYLNGDGYNEVNRIIVQKVRSYAAEYASDASGDTVTLDYQFNVALNNSKMISLYFWGESYVSSAPHPNADFYTLNIDLATGKELKLSDLYTVNADFEKVFYDQARQTGGVDDMLDNTRSQEGSITDPFAYPDALPCYLTLDGLVLSLPVSHAEGDHFEALLKYGDIQQFYKLKQIYWEE
ncbi:MAG: copper amine oxidase N-terminal domain-containing protein, partial [Firmicutes bacterium]|nr:copper amine oxidase N-terminal domain-containing protein [Bacillota bacterium]